MSPRGPDFEDPFAGDDPAARERARRRAEREAKRRQRDNRASLGERVSGAIDGAAARGRERIERSRERARSPEPPAGGVDPPSFRRPAPERAETGPVQAESGPPRATSEPRRAGPGPLRADPRPQRADPRPMRAAPAPERVGSRAERADPRPQRADPAREPADPGPPPAGAAPAPGGATAADEAGRISAEEAMPRREALFRPRPIDTSEGDALAPEPLAVPPSRGRAGESEEWAAAAAAPPGRRPPRRPAAVEATLWRRRLLALVAIVVLLAAAVILLTRLGGGGETPAAGPAPSVKTTDVTIPEGLTATEIAKVAKQAGLKGDYAKAEKQAAKKFDVHKRGGPKDATLEGFLFPATYEVEKGASVADLIDKQLYEGFEPNFAEVDMAKAKKAGFSEYDVVTIASMIEREVQVPKEAPKVAAVIYNRIAQGIPLEIDATVRYAIGNDFSKALDPADLEVDSPYNTYRFQGLPAGPISNPGLNALKAAADPSGDDYLYYVVKPDTCPAEHFFTDDYDEFVAASQKYDAAQAAAGGKPNC